MRYWFFRGLAFHFVLFSFSHFSLASQASYDLTPTYNDVHLLKTVLPALRQALVDMQQRTDKGKAFDTVDNGSKSWFLFAEYQARIAQFQSFTRQIRRLGLSIFRKEWKDFLLTEGGRELPDYGTIEKGDWEAAIRRQIEFLKAVQGNLNKIQLSVEASKDSDLIGLLKLIESNSKHFTEEFANSIRELVELRNLRDRRNALEKDVEKFEAKVAELKEMAHIFIRNLNTSENRTAEVNYNMNKTIPSGHLVYLLKSDLHGRLAQALKKFHRSNQARYKGFLPNINVSVEFMSSRASLGGILGSVDGFQTRIMFDGLVSGTTQETEIQVPSIEFIAQLDGNGKLLNTSAYLEFIEEYIDKDLVRRAIPQAAKKEDSMLVRITALFYKSCGPWLGKPSDYQGE